MTKVKEEMLYIEERVALNNIINELQVAVDFLKRVNNGFSYRVFNIARLDSRVKSGMTIDEVSLSEAESLKEYLDSVLRHSMDSLDDFQQGINDLSDLIDEVKGRTSGGGA